MISKRYGPVQANNDVSLEVYAGEIHAVVGENGSGKSTLLGIATGTVAADSGVVEIDGRPLTTASAKAAMALGLGMAYQTMTEVIGLTVAENLFLAAPSGRRPKLRADGAVGGRHARRVRARHLARPPRRRACRWPSGRCSRSSRRCCRSRRCCCSTSRRRRSATATSSGCTTSSATLAAAGHRHRVRQPPPPRGAHRRRPRHGPARRRQPGHVRRRGHVRGRRRQADDRPPARPRLPRAGRGSRATSCCSRSPSSAAVGSGRSTCSSRRGEIVGHRRRRGQRPGPVPARPRRRRAVERHRALRRQGGRPATRRRGRCGPASCCSARTARRSRSSPPSAYAPTPRCRC